jgi:hypothetical protein
MDTPPITAAERKSRSVLILVFGQRAHRLKPVKLTSANLRQERRNKLSQSGRKQNSDCAVNAERDQAKFLRRSLISRPKLDNHVFLSSHRLSVQERHRVAPLANSSDHRRNQ